MNTEIPPAGHKHKSHLLIVSKGEIQQHILLQQVPDGSLIDVGGFVAEQLGVVHVLRGRGGTMRPFTLDLQSVASSGASAGNTYPLLSQQLAGLLQVLCCLIPNVGMVAQHQQALLVRKHNCGWEKQPLTGMWRAGSLTNTLWGLSALQNLTCS